MPQPQQRWSMMMIVTCVLTYLAGLCILIAFASPNWLQKNPRVPNKFLNMGLWEFCFNQFTHPELAYSRAFTGCRWVFHRYYDILLDFLEPPWFIAVQVSMSIGLLVLICALGLTVAVILNCCVKRLTRNLLILGVLLFTACFWHTLAVLIFGVRGDDRDWLPSPQWNRFGYSFGFACVGAIVEFVSGLLFLLEWQRVRKNRAMTNSYPHQQTSAFHMSQYRYPPATKPHSNV